MCGRFTLTAALKDIQSRFDFDADDIKAIEKDYRPGKNISPTQTVLTILRGEKPLQPRLMRWGLIPSWSREKKNKWNLINARAETIFIKPMFRALIRRSRCLIPADGFYEFRAEDKKKIPVLFSLRETGIFAMAGIYDQWQDEASGSILYSCSILTTEPNALVRPIHNRMPVILHRHDEKRWLDEHLQENELSALLIPYNAEQMEYREINRSLTSTQNENLFTSFDQ